MFMLDTLVAFSKLVTILVIIMLCSISIIFTCPGYWISQGKIREFHVV